MFSVESSGESGPSKQTEAYFPRDMGVSFIHAFFDIMHPQMPLLSYSDIMETWNKLWEPPRPGICTLKGKELVYMVLAIGARASNARGEQTPEWIDLWAEHFSRRADNYNVMFQEPSLKGTHFMLLKVSRSEQRPRGWLMIQIIGDVCSTGNEAQRGISLLWIRRSQRDGIGNQPITGYRWE